MGQYPRQLNLGEAVKDRLVTYINDELYRHRAERQRALDDLIQMQTDYWAKPSTERKTFPFTGASSVVIPLTAIAVETIHARTITSLFGVVPFASVKARRDDFQKFENPLEDYLQYELTTNIKFYRPFNDIALELEKFGTGIGKSGYEKIVRKAVRTSPDGKTEEEFAVVKKDGATIDGVPNANFIMPHSAKDPQTAPWCGEYHSESPHTVLQMEQSGLFYSGITEKLKPAVSQLSQEGTNQERKYDRQMQTLEKREADFPKMLDWAELWMSFDVDEDGYDEEIVVHFHQDTNNLMSCRYNWNSDLHRPYRYGNYIIVENRWRGIGICKQNEQFQRSITTQHRQRLDNATIANMRMFKVHKLSGYGPKEPIFPGKMWFLDDMTHIESVEMGDVRQSAFSDEQATLIYSHQRTGVNEVVLGMPPQGTPGTATGDLARIREGQNKFDFVMKNIKDLTNELLMDALVNIHQFGSKNIAYFDYSDHGDLLRELFTMDIALIRDGILFDVAAAGQQSNRIADRQNWVQIAQILQNYFVGMVQLGEMTQDPQIMKLIIGKGFVAATEAMRQVLETFDVRNVDRMVLTELEQMFQQQLTGAGGNGGSNGSPNNRLSAVLGGGGNPGSPGNGQAPGMDLLVKALAGLGGGGAAGAPGLS